MASVRAEISRTMFPSDTPDEVSINVLHFNGGTDYEALAGHLVDAFSGVMTPEFSLYRFDKLDVRVYDIADTKPRPIRGEATYTPTGWGGGTALPRLLACCLSFYGTRNIKRQRGHIYIGPFRDGAGLEPTETIGSAAMSNILALGQDLHALTDWTHIVRSNVGDGLESPVTNYWVDDRWDVQHSRQAKAGVRVRFPS